MIGRKLLGAALALLMMLAGCAGKEAPPSSETSRPAPPPASEQEPAPESRQEPELEVIPMVGCTLQSLPAEALEAVTADGFRWGDMGAPDLMAEWVDDNRLLFFSYRSDPPRGISDCRIFLYDIAAQRMTRLVDGAFPELCPEVFFRDGAPCVNFAAKDAVTLRLDLENGSYESSRGDAWDFSRKGMILAADGAGEASVLDGLDREQVFATFRTAPEETFAGWSPDGECLAFQLQNGSRVAVYLMTGEKVREFSSQPWGWEWCRTPGYLTYTPPAGKWTDRTLLNYLEGTETELPGSGEGARVLLREPEFSLLTDGGRSFLLDHRVGKRVPLELGDLSCAVYRPESSTILGLAHRQSADGGREWLEGYLLTLDLPAD